MPSFSADAREQVAPASLMQERLYRASPGGNDTATVLFSWRLDGQPDVPRWKAAVERLAARQASLRTTLVSDAGSIHQLVTPDVEIPVVVRRDAIGADRRPQLQRTVDALARAPLRLDAPPLVDVTLLDGGADSFALWRLSHAIADEYSGRVLLSDFASFYSGASPPPLSLDVGDIAIGERALVEPRSQHREWVEALGARLAELKSHAVGPYVAASRELGPITVEETGQLALTARRARCSLAVGLLTAFCLALHKKRALDRSIIGLLDANRDSPGFDRLIGCLFNVMLVPITLSPSCELTEALGRVRDQVFAAYDHRLPLGQQLLHGDVAQRGGLAPICDATFNAHTTVLQPAHQQPNAGPVLQPGIVAPTRRRSHVNGPWTGAHLGFTAATLPSGALGAWLSHSDTPADEAEATAVGSAMRDLIRQGA